MTFLRHLTIDGHKYRLYRVSYDNQLRVAGPYLRTTQTLPEGIGEFSDNLREAIRRQIAADRLIAQELSRVKE